MLSKILTLTALSSGFVSADGTKMADILQDIWCKTAEQGADFYKELVLDAAQLSAVRHAVGLTDAETEMITMDDETIMAAALKYCPKCPEDGPGTNSTGPGANCRQRTVGAGTIMQIMGGYGCWGNFPAFPAAASDSTLFASLVQYGRGKPLDTLDEAARDLTQGYKCIMEEYFKETGSTCEPWNETYDLDTTASGTGSGLSQYTAQCSGTTHSCNLKACMIETLFTVRYAAWQTSYGGTQPPYDERTFYHPTSMWAATGYTGTGTPFTGNTVQNCPTQGQVTHVYCCGEYPHRQRLHSSTTTDQCCAGTVYDDSTHHCCGDPNILGLTTATTQLKTVAC